MADIVSKSQNVKTTYEVFEEELGMIIKEQSEISVTGVPIDILKSLKLKKGSYCLKNSRITFTDRKKP